MLHELVKLVHVDIDQELRREIAERKTEPFACALEARDDLYEKPEHIAVRHALSKDTDETALVYGCKELPHIAFQYPDCACVIA